MARALAQLVVLRGDLAASRPVLWCCGVGLVVSTLWLLASGRAAGRAVPWPQLAAVVAIVFAAGWGVVDQRLEGPTLVVLSSSHGITLSDVPALVVGLLAVRRLLGGGAAGAHARHRWPARSR